MSNVNSNLNVKGSNSLPEIPGRPDSLDSVVSRGGSFIIYDSNGNPVSADLGTLLMMLSLTRTENLDKQIAIQLSDIQDRNKMISIMTECMAKAREVKANGGDMSKATILVDGQPRTIKQVMEGMGVKIQDITANDAKDKTRRDMLWDNNIASIRSRIDVLNNDSQMANIKLQNVLEKRNNSFDMASKVMQTNNQSVQSIIRNL